MEKRELFVALGSTSYRVNRPWGDLPANAGRISDVAVDSREHIFVLLRYDPLVGSQGPAVVELAPDGRRLATWSEELIADGHMIACSSDDRIFVVDRDTHQIVIFDVLGQRLGALGSRGRPLAPFNHPCDVAFGPGGEIYVCDGYANSRVHCFSAAGQLIRSWGERGIGPGQFVSPHGIWVTPDARVIVADRDNNRLQVFTTDGELLEIWTGFHRPTDIWGNALGQLYVVDQVPSLTLLSSTGDFLGRCRPVLNGAHGISGCTRDGHLYLAEGSPSRITQLEALLV